MKKLKHNPPLKVFFSYSHKDEGFKDELEIHLKILQRQGLIESWNDRMIVAGKEWETEIDSNLKQADIILLLVSAYLLASDYCYDKELSIAMQHHEAGKAVVIPIFIRPCDWQGAPFSKLQGLPKNAKPVTTWDDQHEAWADIANSLRKTINSFSATRKHKNESNLSKRTLEINQADKIKRDKLRLDTPTKSKSEPNLLPKYAHKNELNSKHIFSIGDTIEVNCDYEKNKSRVRGWLKGTIVQTDDNLIGVQFSENVFLTNGYSVPDRILWYPKSSEQIRSLR